MKRWIIPLCLVGLVVAIPGDAQASNNACQLDGVWYGYNDYPEDFIMTITKAGGGRYTAVVMDTCDSWSALTTWDLYQFEPGVGDDALAEENFLFSLGQFTLTYQRMP